MCTALYQQSDEHLGFADFMPSVHPKIFLSSTYIDLRNARAEVIRWLVGIFGASLVVMESSGSDAAPPNVLSIRRVRQCDIFVGIYGHRYGTVDPASGESITELELDEARNAQSAGVVSDLLLYRIDSTSPWLSEFADSSKESQIGHSRLNQKLHQHTYTVFRTETELLFSIVRDVYRSIAQRFFSERRPLRPYNPPSPRPAHRPVGMEFLTSGDAKYLIGRADAVHEAITQLQHESMVLLLGESGIGKTSLIHAGIIPEAAALGWRPVYTRPLGMPCTDVVDQIEASLFVDGIRHAPILQTIAELLSALGDGHLLLIIDQFEDVLDSISSENLEELLSGLSALRELSEPRLHILVSYRADLEGRLGTLWQRISGSPRGLARVYISGLNAASFWDQLQHVCDDLAIPLTLTDHEADLVLSDITVASKNWVPSGLYPPYIQMFIDFMFSSRGQGEPFTFQAYQKAGRIFEIVHHYLSKQLRLAQDDAGDLRLLLIALVKSYGVKAQRSLQELVADTGLEPAHCEAQLERLIDLRLARHISGRYEVSHDFLAKIITEELVDSEEREFKRFRELLSSRATAFASTSSRLTVEEVLFLYKHKRRIIYSNLEAILIIDTWIKEDVPGLFWIKDFDKKIVEQRLAIYDGIDLDPEQRFRIARLKWLFGVSLDDNDYLAIINIWKGANEAARMLMRLREQVPASVALVGLGGRQSAIRNACGEVLTTRARNCEWHIVASLRRSQRKSHFSLFFELAIDPSIPTPEAERERSLIEFRRLQQIMRPPSNQTLEGTVSALRSMRPRRASVLFGEAVLAIRQGRIERLLKKIATSSSKRALPLIIAAETTVSDAEFEGLLQLYITLNKVEIDSERTPAVSSKAGELARVIRRLTSIQRIAELRQMFDEIELKPSARDIVTAILANADVGDVTAILLKIASFPSDMRYENHMELCAAAKGALLRSSTGIPEIYISWAKSRNFWEYLPKKESGSVESGAVLPLKNQGNRPLFIRLLAHAIVGLVRSSEDTLLRSFLHHSFITISSAAAVRMSELIGDAALGALSMEVDEAISAGRADTLASAIRGAEESLYIQPRDTKPHIEAKGEQPLPCQTSPVPEVTSESGRK
jgi:hypothetical protein